MLMSEAFPSKWLSAVDLQGKEVTVAIKEVLIEPITDGDHKPVVYFQGKAKGLVLNKTNANTISDIYGDNSDTWADKPITLFPTYTDFQGKQVPCIRVKPNGAGLVHTPLATEATRENPTPAHDPLDSDIPF